MVASAKLGQDSVAYDTDALTKATEDWGDLNATQYGQLLATKARLVGMGEELCLMNFRDWYTDTVDIWRVVPVQDGSLTRHERRELYRNILAASIRWKRRRSA
ncbi:MAG: hypothetical protein ACLSAF_23010 [Intestinimonas sp.]